MGVEANFRLVQVPFTSRWSLPRLLREARALGPADVVIGRYLYPLLAAARRGEATMFEAHWPPPDRLSAWLERRLLSAPGFVGLVCITERLRHWYQQAYPSNGSGHGRITRCGR